MKKFDFLKYWNLFVHWKGWTVFARSCRRLWIATVSWIGWKKIFRLPLLLTVSLCAVCAAGLVYVFANSLEQRIPSYFLYALSAYSLCALCVQLPSGIRRVKAWLREHPTISALLENQSFMFSFELYFEQFINFAYGIFKIVTGVLVGSAWVGADGIYNLTQALIQLFQILRRKNPGTITQQWKSYRVCGVLVLLMHLTLTGIVFQMINWNRYEDHAGYMIFATAAFAFYKIISSFIHVAKDRKHTHPIDSSVRMLELSQAIFAIFSLQASLLHTFGTGESWEGLLNTVTGCVVCLMVASMGVYMIRRGNREIKKIQENQNG